MRAGADRVRVLVATESQVLLVDPERGTTTPAAGPRDRPSTFDIPAAADKHERRCGI